MTNTPPASWWNIMQLRSEVVASDGVISDTRMSLHNAAVATTAQALYASPSYYGDITHPAGTLVDFMARVAVHLGIPHSAQTKAAWRLDQAMGGGKSHGLVGLWHLAVNPRRFAATDLGRDVFGAAFDITGRVLPSNLGNPHCVVLDCDNTTATEEDRGPGKQLGERFLWRLFQGNHDQYAAFQPHVSNKAKLAEAFRTVGRPVLILVDEIMDYLRVAAVGNPDGAILDMAFLRALLDAVNTVPNCVCVVAMVASGKDNMAMTTLGGNLRQELEDLLTRNATTTAVTSDRDFAEIVQRRLFVSPPPPSITDQVADLYVDTVTPAWENKAFKELRHPHRHEFRRQVRRSYPFHPNLIALAENEWATHTGFQKARSAINVFALTVFEQARRGQSGQWAPPLIDSGDLPLDYPPLRDALLNSGLVADDRTRDNLREVATVDIADPHNPRRGTARQLDRNRDETWAWVRHNPHAGQRIATALFVRSLGPRAGGARGATEAELLAASYAPTGTYEAGDAETVLGDLTVPERGLASAEHIAGQGNTPPRWVFETRKTLEMLTRAEKKTISDADRDKAITDRAFRIASETRRPFGKVLLVEGPPVPLTGVTVEQCRRILLGELVDSRETRLAILDSRWFSLFNSDDSTTRESLESVFGLGTWALNHEWASSAVFACANTDLRAQARGLAVEWLARHRVSQLPTVQTDPDMRHRAERKEEEAEHQLGEAVKLCYKHVVYLAPKGEHRRRVGTVRMGNNTRTALNAQDVWDELCDESKAFHPGQFTSEALLHNLRDSDYGRPLNELRNAWWSNPHKPLLVEGETELAQAIFQSIESGEVLLVGADGQAHHVAHPDNIDLASNTVRLMRNDPAPPVPDCATCGIVESECVCLPVPDCATCGCVTSECVCPSASAHWQVTVNVSANPDGGHADLALLLREIADRVEDGSVVHVTQFTQLTIAGEEETIDAVRQRAGKAGATFNAKKL